MGERVFGDIPDHPEGTIFESRSDLARSGVHRPTQAGISGSAKDGADSIVLSGGYEDDQDFGDIIIYTGHGGRDPETRQQVTDQLLRGGNLALAHSCMNGLPVRVIRGTNHRSSYSPYVGYRYDGLYRIEDYWREKGTSGYTIWRYRLIKFTTPSVAPKQLQEASEVYDPTPRQPSSILRIVRDTELTRMIKQLYDYSCQVCHIRLEGTAGPYAEAAHIRPLGTPHNGPDTLENVLCLCPNHHVLFDYGGFAIDDDLRLLGIEGALNVKPEHTINTDYLRYHRVHYYNGI